MRYNTDLQRKGEMDKEAINIVRIPRRKFACRCVWRRWYATRKSCQIGNNTNTHEYGTLFIDKTQLNSSPHQWSQLAKMIVDSVLSLFWPGILVKVGVWCIYDHHPYHQNRVLISHEMSKVYRCCNNERNRDYFQGQVSDVLSRKTENPECFPKEITSPLQ